MKKRFFSAIFVCLSAVGLQATTSRPAAAQRWTLPDSVQRQVDEVFSFVERDAPGCALGVARDGRLGYGRGYGLANLDWGIPITTSSVFDIGSVSKQFTASALALLEQDEVLSLEDDVRKWVPELPDYGTPITIRHLLNHTSGLRDYLTLMNLAGIEFANVFDEFDGVELIARQKALNFEPGSEFLYSNSGYLLLANIVRRAAGVSIREFLEDRLFDPLGMAGSSIWDDNTEIVPERAYGYSPSEEGWAIDHAWNFQMGGDGQVLTSVEDLLKWDNHFYLPEVGGQGFLDRLHTRGILNNGDTIPYALGLTLDEYRGLRRVQHGGAWAGFRAMLARYPDEHTSVIILCNRGDANPGGLANRVADAVLASEFPEVASEEEPEETGEAVSLSDTQLQRWAGLYRHPERPDYLRLEVTEGQLAIRMGESTYPLSPQSEDRFILEVTGQPMVFSAAEGRDQVQFGSTTYGRVQVPDLSVDLLTRYQGRYYSEELDTTYEIHLDGGSLRLHRPGRDPAVLDPGVEGEFEVGGMGLTFMEEGGRVTGLRVFAGRVTGIVFEVQSGGE